ncbi:hypothetical protein N8I74_00900 [Chitiniphilus purpureus]|uniref:Phosphomannomutase n=1 Tax=Chitiniphilus purpureus TaxID=2981137 RepID=A0ABY6DMK8_9NEIS|nr:phosphomannomutase [Chitiniphilus sp. CD1]UXY15605.1 hypothetical protein N8I74_00900 [Chitiniphilus sp. CD1]
MSFAETAQLGFGTSGLRGQVALLTDPVCAAYTTAFIEQVAPTAQHVLLGHDLRPSSPRIAAACAAALTRMGLTVIYGGALPTPALALYGLTHRLPTIVVTGSHIPFDRNGIKFFGPDGEITKADETAISAALGRHTTQAPPDPADLPVAMPEVRALYVARYLDHFGRDSLAGRRLVVYQHSSVARDLFSDVLTGLGAAVTALGRCDDFVAIDTEALSEADCERARLWAAQYRFDALISADGDGDRPMLADELGQWLRGDVVGLLAAHQLGIERLAVPLTCSSALEASGLFKEVRRTRIGSPYVIAGLEALGRSYPHDRIAGFEANGGFLLASPAGTGPAPLAPLPTRDALLPILAVLTAQSASAPLSAQVDRLPKRHTASARLPDVERAVSDRLIQLTEAKPERLLEALGKHGVPVTTADTTDGLRLLLGDGDIVHLRPSGNAPELRCYAESHDPATAQQLCQAMLDAIGQWCDGKRLPHLMA